MLLPSSTIWWMPSSMAPGQRCICQPGWDLDLISWPTSLSPRSRRSLIKKAIYSFLDHGTHGSRDGAGSLIWDVKVSDGHLLCNGLCFSIVISQLVLKLKEQLVPDWTPEGPTKQITVKIFDFDQILQNRKIKHIGNAGNVVFITWFNSRIFLQDQIS